ncbi:MAG: DUF2845 domain-containing protein [Gammaproteobacteria bacterium]
MNNRVRMAPPRAAGRRRSTGTFRTPVLALCMLLVCALGTEAHAFRCGNKLVSEGMHVTKVIAICGEPDYEQRRVVLRQHVYIGRTTRDPESDAILRHIYGWGTPPLVEVEIRELTWNLGPNRFMRRVRFEDGIVTEIETLERGYVE